MGFLCLVIIKKKSNKKIIKVAIYGAGDAGAQLAKNLNVERGYEIKFFIDDNKLLHQRFINGIPIKSSNHLKINSKKIHSRPLSLHFLTFTLRIYR